MRLPGFHHLPEDGKLADVVGIVVGHQQHLTEDGVVWGMRNGAKEISVGILHQLLNGLQIGLKFGDGLLPARFVSLRSGCRFESRPA